MARREPLPPDEGDERRDDLPDEVVARDELARQADDDDTVVVERRGDAPPMRQEPRWRFVLRKSGKALLAIVTAALAIVAIGLTALWVYTNTDWGRERVRRFAISQFERSTHGRLRIGRIEGNLLQGATVHALAITDSAGAPFVAADSARLRYVPLDFWRRRLWFDDVTLWRPVVVLDKPKSGAPWNWRRIFPRAKPGVPNDTTPGFGDWVRITDLTVIDGELISRTPWHPSEEKSAAEQRADIREALAGEKRLVVVRGAEGLQKILRLRHVTGMVPRLVLADPKLDWREADVASLAMVAQPFHPPYAQVTDATGRIRFDGDSAWWRGLRLRTPGSRVTGDGRYWWGNDEVWIKGHAAQAALADWRWVYPRLPSNGGGVLDFEYAMNTERMTFVARNADVRTGGARAQGSLGMTFVDIGATDTLIMHDTRLRVAHVPVKLLEQLIDFESPRQGLLSGRVTVAGGVHAMRVDGDVVFDETRSGYNHVIGGGVLGFLSKKETGGKADMTFRDLRLRLLPMKVAILYEDFPKLPIGGTLTGNVVANGSSQTGMRLTGDVVHDDVTGRSAFTGRASVDWRDALPLPRFEVNGTLHPGSVATFGRWFPDWGLRGYASGPIYAIGTLEDLRLRTALDVAGGGWIAAEGRLAPGPSKATPLVYDMDVRMRGFDASAITTKAPSTSLTGTFLADGRGTTPETLSGRFALDLHGSRVDTIAVDSAVARVAVSGGLARVERAVVGARSGEAVVAGSFGLRRGAAGDLTYNVRVADLGAFRSFIPGVAGDTAVVRPRPGILAARVRQARADSARTARETEIERIVTGKPLPRFAVDTPHAIPKNAVGGSIQTSGRVRGWLGDFDVRGRAAGQNVVAKGNAAASFRSEYAVVHGRTDRASYIVGLQADSLSAFGFAFDTVDARLALSKPTGRIELVARQGNDREIGVWGNLAFHPEHSELHLSNVVFRIDTTRWTLAGPAAVQWGGTGVVVRNVDLRNPSEGRIWVDGRLPTSGSAALDVAVDELDVGSALAFAQSDVALDGRLTARGRLEGTLADPRFRGAFGLRNAHYADAQVPELRGSFAYANRSLTTNVLALQDGAQVATVNGTIPINLALSGVTGDRLGDAGVNVTVAADSLPLDLVGRVTDVVSDVKGVAAGRIAIRGALTRPALTGALAIRNGEATITATGGRLTNVFGAVRMLRDTVTIDSLVGRMGAGDVRLTGGLAVGDWREPAFNLYLVARDAEVMHGDRGRLWADAGLALTGPFKNAYLSGQATVRRGVVYIPEGRKDVLSSSDPTLFAVLDTAVMADRELLPGESPLMENLRLDVDVEIDRNTWVRSRDANVEVFSDGLLHVHRERTASGRAVPAITGVIATERGEYRLFSKRFVVKRGSAVFIGATEINPLLQATAEYEVRPAGREAINIRVVLGGTMNNPRITLESDARPPLSQTDLLSYLAFGKETTSLLDFEGSPLSSQSGNPNLVGVSRVAGRRLAGVALGVALDEAEGEAGRELGVDVFNITPEDVPTEFATSDVEAFLLGTRFEVGKYVNPRTFVQLSGSPSALRIGRGQSRIPPGARIEYRTPIGWRYEAFVEPRLRLRDPTLSSQQKPVSPLPVFGVFIIREWRF